MSRLASMTGFASVDGTAQGRGFVLSVKGVNHRHLDLQMRLPSGLDALEAALRAAVKTQVRRGHIELTMTLEKTSPGTTVELDDTVLAAYVTAFKQSAAQYGLVQDLDLHALLRMPGVMVASVSAMDASTMQATVLTATEDVLRKFNAVRVAEGEVLAAELRIAMKRLTRLIDEARGLRDAMPGTELARLKTRMGELLAGVGVGEERLIVEAALLTARGDVEEELVRLRAHVERFVQLLEGGGELGRQLDFLLQELNREANTMLSKIGGGAESGLRLTEIGLEMKVELERAREQVQNLE